MTSMRCVLPGLSLMGVSTAVVAAPWLGAPAVFALGAVALLGVAARVVRLEEQAIAAKAGRR